MQGRMIDILPIKKVPKKCKFCGDSLSHLSYPKYTQSDCINSVCLNRKCPERSRGGYYATFYGRYPNKPKWYTGKEWEEWINAEVS